MSSYTIAAWPSILGTKGFTIMDKMVESKKFSVWHIKTILRLVFFQMFVHINFELEHKTIVQ